MIFRLALITISVAAWTQRRLELGPEDDVVRITEYPLNNGLQQYLQINQESLLESVLQHSLDQLPRLPNNSMQMKDTCPNFPPDQLSVLKNISSVTLFFDTAGTGKTTAIQDIIRQNFGSYCLSPNLLPSDTGILNSVIAPDRACASRDTYSMYYDIKALGNLDLTSQRWDTFIGVFSDWMFEPLNKARKQLLEIFKRINSTSSGDEQQAQTKWLQLQISCWLGNVPFDVAYRFFRFQPRKTIDQVRHANTAGPEMI